MNDSLLVTSEWLSDRLGQSSLSIVEASFFLPDEGIDAAELFRQGHIPGAVRFDVDTIADHAQDLPHMLPDPATFSKMVGALGIAQSDRIIVYDRTDLLGAARAWWMFRHYGAQDVHVLDGGYKAWLAAGSPVEQGDAKPAPAEFKVDTGAGTVVDASDVLAASNSNSAQIVDVRASARFAGTVPEPRPGLRSGHIPEALNLPWRKLVDDTGRLRQPDEIAAVLRASSVDADRPIIASCGSGVSAAILLLGLERLRQNGMLASETALYDGSWAEWGSRSDLPIATENNRT